MLRAENVEYAFVLSVVPSVNALAVLAFDLLCNVRDVVKSYYFTCSLKECFSVNLLNSSSNCLTFYNRIY